jgi:hypothetical protein
MKLLHYGRPSLYLLPALLLFGRSVASQRMEAELPPLELTVAIPKSTFPVAERIPVYVKLTNKSDHEVLVGRYLTPLQNAPSSLQLIVEDTTGRISPGPIIYIEVNAKAVQAWWLGLPPSHSYGFDQWLDEKSYPVLDKPGKYCIRAIYVSSGTKLVSDNTSNLDKQKRSPAKSNVWKGELRSSPVCVDITPAN